MNTAIERSERAELTSLAERYQRIRSFSETLCETLEPEDCCIQSMPDASPIRWHLAHTTWFFETFVLAQTRHYHGVPNRIRLLVQFLLQRHRQAVSAGTSRAAVAAHGGASLGISPRNRWHMLDLLTKNDAIREFDLAPIVELGLHHEQQHQELMLTDIKHALSCNPMYPIYRPATFYPGIRRRTLDGRGSRREFTGLVTKGKTSRFDNESPRHRTFLESFAISNRLVTCGEYLEFIDDGGYRRPELWLSEGWRHAADQNWQAPLYWFQREGAWNEFTL